MVDISYAHAQQYAAFLNSLNPRLVLMNGGSFASPIQNSTMSQVASAEIAVDATRYPTRPTLTFAATVNTTTQRVEVKATVTIPAAASTPSWNRYAIIGDAYGGIGSGSGSATNANTSGAMLYIGGTAVTVTPVSTQAYIADVIVEVGARYSTFTA